MATQEISKEQWTDYLNAFSKRHQGRPATLEVMGTDIGDQLEGTARPFQGISAETKGSAAGSVIVMLGTETEDHIEQVISDVSTVSVDSPQEDDINQSMEIVAGDGVKYLLTFP